MIFEELVVLILEFNRESGENPELPRSGKRERKPNQHWRNPGSLAGSAFKTPSSPKTCIKYLIFNEIHFDFRGRNQ